jgi:dienelactone hydrolase
MAQEPDELLASALAHWAPRLTTNGIAVGDFEVVKSQISRWDQWCQAWCDLGAVHEALGREALAEGRTRSAGQHLAQAAVYFHFAKFVFVVDLDQMKAAHASAVRCYMDALPLLDPPGERIEVPFDGSKMVGVLKKPVGSGPHPVVMLIPGLDSTKEELQSTEALFLQRGLATFSVDGPGQGESEYDLPIRPDWEVPGGELLEAIASRPDIDGDRMGVWGVSLGGYYAPRVASGVDRVKACIALAGPFNFQEVIDTAPELTRATFQVRSHSLSREEAREKAGELNMAGQAEKISCPLLIVFGKQDRLIPYRHAEQLYAAAGGPKELLMLEDGNHGCMNVAAKHRYRSADWMAAQLYA